MLHSPGADLLFVGGGVGGDCRRSVAERRHFPLAQQTKRQIQSGLSDFIFIRVYEYKYVSIHTNMYVYTSIYIHTNII